MKAVLLIDHGSRREAANNMLECMATLVQQMAGPRVIVRAAHMELAEPDIPQGFTACVESGATEVVVFPYMLSPGRHSTNDIPNMVAEAALAHPGVPYTVTTAFGVHEKLAQVILERAGVEAGPAPVEGRCMRPEGTPERFCGDGCRCVAAGLVPGARVA